jgi:hypothetical protein
MEGVDMAFLLSLEEDLTSILRMKDEKQKFMRQAPFLGVVARHKKTRCGAAKVSQTRNKRKKTQSFLKTAVLSFYLQPYLSKSPPRHPKNLTSILFTIKTYLTTCLRSICPFVRDDSPGSLIRRLFSFSLAFFLRTLAPILECTIAYQRHSTSTGAVVAHTLTVVARRKYLTDVRGERGG